METMYIVQAFTMQENDNEPRLAADLPLKFRNKDRAIEKAEKLSQSKTWIIVISQDYQDGECKEGNTHVLARYGSIPTRRISYED